MERLTLEQVNAEIDKLNEKITAAEKRGLKELADELRDARDRMEREARRLSNTEPRTSK